MDREAQSKLLAMFKVINKDIENWKALENWIEYEKKKKTESSSQHAQAFVYFHVSRSRVSTLLKYIEVATEVWEPHATVQNMSSAQLKKTT